MTDSKPEPNSKKHPTSPKGVGRVRSDAGRLNSFVRSIQSPYLWVGLVIYLAGATVGTFVALTAPLNDWFMHAAMYVTLFGLLLVYVRSAQLRRPIARVVYAIVAALLLSFFAWALFDLVEPRLDVVERVDEAGRSIPALEERGQLAWLKFPAIACVITAGWLVIHMLFIARLGGGTTGKTVEASSS